MKTLKKKGSRVLAMLLAFVMFFTMIPTTAFAAEDENSAEVPVIAYQPAAEKSFAAGATLIRFDICRESQ